MIIYGPSMIIYGPYMINDHIWTIYDHIWTIYDHIWSPDGHPMAPCWPPNDQKSRPRKKIKHKNLFWDVFAPNRGNEDVDDTKKIANGGLRSKFRLTARKLCPMRFYQRPCRVLVGFVYGYCRVLAGPCSALVGFL